MGNFGFSYVGLVYLLMLLIPNIIWTKHQPTDYDFRQENRLLLSLERIGQVCVTCCVLFFSDFNVAAFSPWSWWLVVSFALMLLYELFWIRYFTGKHTMKDFYRSFCGVPVPGATLPVVAFMLLGIYGKVVWMLVSVIVLGVGHVGIHLQHLKELNLNTNK